MLWLLRAVDRRVGEAEAARRAGGRSPARGLRSCASERSWRFFGTSMQTSTSAGLDVEATSPRSCAPEVGDRLVDLVGAGLEPRRATGLRRPGGRRSRPPRRSAPGGTGALEARDGAVRRRVLDPAACELAGKLLLEPVEGRVERLLRVESRPRLRRG